MTSRGGRLEERERPAPPAPVLPASIVDAGSRLAVTRAALEDSAASGQDRAGGLVYRAGSPSARDEREGPDEASAFPGPLQHREGRETGLPRDTMTSFGHVRIPNPSCAVSLADHPAGGIVQENPFFRTHARRQMDDQVIAIYCLIDDFLHHYGYTNASECVVSDAEVLTVAVRSTLLRRQLRGRLALPDRPCLHVHVASAPGQFSAPLWRRVAHCR